MKAYIDFDYAVYAAGFSAQHTYHLLTSGDDLILGSFEKKPYLKKAVKEAVANGMDEEVLLSWSRLEVEDVVNPMHTMKLNLQKIKDRLEEKFECAVETEVFLTGKDNFRDNVATIRPYKGNRDPNHRPAHYVQLRDYLMEHQNAQLIEGWEADDEVCIRQAQSTLKGEQSVIVGIDKDLWQCPGWHYSPLKDAFAKITPKQGLKLFYKQLLIGDATDNIPGIYMMGEAGCKKVLDGLKTEEEMYAAVIKAYAAGIEKYGYRERYFVEGMSVEQHVLENARLLYMYRFYGDTWLPPGERDGK